ncbi:MAG: NHL repeat-containing protein, partial [Anaerolineae bacterium]|nr:NHL repeat-containing protein [Anaerolineae bacterium]
MSRPRYINAAVGLCALLLALGLYGLPGSAQAQNPDGFAFSGEANDLYRAGTVFASGLSAPFGMAFDAAGNMYVANEGPSGTYGNTIAKITPAGVISTFATGFTGPSGVAFNSSGLLHVSDDTSRVFSVSAAGVPSVYIPNTVGLNNPNAIAFDPSTDWLYVANAGGFISEFNATGGLVDLTLASSLNLSQSVAFDSAGDLYFSEFDGKIHKVDMTTRVITQYADMGAFGTTQGGLAFDSFDNLYYSDQLNNRVIRIDASDQTGTVCQTGINLARGLAFDAAGNLYVSAPGTNDIWKFTGCAPTGDVSGLITDSTTSTAIDNIQVCADYDSGEHIQCHCTTGGTYTIYDITLDTPFSVRAGGNTDMCDTSLLYVGQNVSGLTVTSGTPQVTQDFALDPGGEVNGTVTEDQAPYDPIENMTVCANYDDDRHIQCVCTEPGGIYRIKGVEFDEPFNVAAGGGSSMCDTSLNYGQVRYD